MKKRGDTRNRAVPGNLVFAWEKPNKYGAKKAVVIIHPNGYPEVFEKTIADAMGIQYKAVDVFDSIAEGRYYVDLLLSMAKGGIRQIQRQQLFHLYGKNGTKVGRTRVDFVLLLENGTRQIHESKGHRVRDYPLREKLLLDNYPDIELWVNHERVH